MDNNNLEQYPGFKVESAGEREVAPEEDFAKAFETGMPPFAGEQNSETQYEQGSETQYGQAAVENLYYGEAKGDGENGDVGEQYDAGIADAAALINYGLDAAARELGVETVVQKIKGFDAGGREDPIGDLFKELGVDTPEEAEAVREEGMATMANEREFREGVNNPGQRRSYEGAFEALSDMKELISEVEGADPRYEELREGARAAGKGYFEYAVSKFGSQGLTELFGVLAEQREKMDEEGEGENELKTEDAVPVEEEEEEKGKGLFDEDEPEEKLNPEILRKQM